MAKNLRYSGASGTPRATTHLVEKNPPPEMRALLDRIGSMERELDRLRAELARKDRIIAGLQHRLFGSSSEKLDPDQLQLLFDEMVLGMQTIPSSLRRRRLQAAWT